MKKFNNSTNSGNEKAIKLGKTVPPDAVGLAYFDTEEVVPSNSLSILDLSDTIPENRIKNINNNEAILAFADEFGALRTADGRNSFPVDDLTISDLYIDKPTSAELVDLESVNANSFVHYYYASKYFIAAPSFFSIYSLADFLTDTNTRDLRIAVVDENGSDYVDANTGRKKYRFLLEPFRTLVNSNRSENPHRVIVLLDSDPPVNLKLIYDKVEVDENGNFHSQILRFSENVNAVPYYEEIPEEAFVIDPNYSNDRKFSIKKINQKYSELVNYSPVESGYQIITPRKAIKDHRIFEAFNWRLIARSRNNINLDLINFGQEIDDSGNIIKRKVKVAVLFSSSNGDTSNSVINPYVFRRLETSPFNLSKYEFENPNSLTSDKNVDEYWKLDIDSISDLSTYDALAWSPTSAITVNQAQKIKNFLRVGGSLILDLSSGPVDAALISTQLQRGSAVSASYIDIVDNSNITSSARTGGWNLAENDFSLTNTASAPPAASVPVRSVFKITPSYTDFYQPQDPIPQGPFPPYIDSSLVEFDRAYPVQPGIAYGTAPVSTPTLDPKTSAPTKNLPPPTSYSFSISGIWGSSTTARVNAVKKYLPFKNKLENSFLDVGPSANPTNSIGLLLQFPNSGDANASGNVIATAFPLMSYCNNIYKLEPADEVGNYNYETFFEPDPVKNVYSGVVEGPFKLLYNAIAYALYCKAKASKVLDVRSTLFNFVSPWNSSWVMDPNALFDDEKKKYFTSVNIDANTTGIARDVIPDNVNVFDFYKSELSKFLPPSQKNVINRLSAENVEFFLECTNDDVVFVNAENIDNFGIVPEETIPTAYHLFRIDQPRQKLYAYTTKPSPRLEVPSSMGSYIITDEIISASEDSNLDNKLSVLSSFKSYPFKFATQYSLVAGADPPASSVYVDLQIELQGTFTAKVGYAQTIYVPQEPPPPFSPSPPPPVFDPAPIVKQIVKEVYDVVRNAREVRSAVDRDIGGFEVSKSTDPTNCYLYTGDIGIHNETRSWKVGSPNHEYVKYIQYSMAALSAQNIAIDGVYGNQTKNAVINFQTQQQQRYKDGSVDSETKSFMAFAWSRMRNTNLSKYNDYVNFASPEIKKYILAAVDAGRTGDIGNKQYKKISFTGFAGPTTAKDIIFFKVPDNVDKIDKIVIEGSDNSIWRNFTVDFYAFSDVPIELINLYSPKANVQIVNLDAKTKDPTINMGGINAGKARYMLVHITGRSMGSTRFGPYAEGFSIAGIKIYGRVIKEVEIELPNPTPTPTPRPTPPPTPPPPTPVPIIGVISIPVYCKIVVQKTELLSAGANKQVFIDPKNLPGSSSTYIAEMSASINGQVYRKSFQPFEKPIGSSYKDSTLSITFANPVNVNVTRATIYSVRDAQNNQYPTSIISLTGPFNNQSTTQLTSSSSTSTKIVLTEEQIGQFQEKFTEAGATHVNLFDTTQYPRPLTFSFGFSGFSYPSVSYMPYFFITYNGIGYQDSIIRTVTSPLPETHYLRDLSGNVYPKGTNNITVNDGVLLLCQSNGKPFGVPDSTIIASAAKSFAANSSTSLGNIDLNLGIVEVENLFPNEEGLIYGFYDIREKEFIGKSLPYIDLIYRGIPNVYIGICAIDADGNTQNKNEFLGPSVDIAFKPVNIPYKTIVPVFSLKYSNSTAVKVSRIPGGLSKFDIWELPITNGSFSRLTALPDDVVYTDWKEQYKGQELYSVYSTVDSNLSVPSEIFGTGYYDVIDESPIYINEKTIQVRRYPILAWNHPTTYDSSRVGIIKCEVNTYIRESVSHPWIRVPESDIRDINCNTGVIEFSRRIVPSNSDLIKVSYVTINKNHLVRQVGGRPIPLNPVLNRDTVQFDQPMYIYLMPKVIYKNRISILGAPDGSPVPAGGYVRLSEYENNIPVNFTFDTKIFDKTSAQYDPFALPIAVIHVTGNPFRRRPAVSDIRRRGGGFSDVEQIYPVIEKYPEITSHWDVYPPSGKAYPRGGYVIIRIPENVRENFQQDEEVYNIIRNNLTAGVVFDLQDLEGNSWS